MNLDELRSVQAKERRKDSLQHLRDTFYEDVASYIADLRAARDRRAERVDNPFSDDDVRRMSDEVETAEEVAEALYERRIGKVVKLASFAAADMPVEQEGMTTQERELFEDLVARIETNKSAVLDVLTGAESSAETDAVGGEDPETRSEPTATPESAAHSTAESKSRETTAPIPPEEPSTEQTAGRAAGTSESSPETRSEAESRGMTENEPDADLERTADGGTLAEAMGSDPPSTDATAETDDPDVTATDPDTDEPAVDAAPHGGMTGTNADGDSVLDRTVVRITRDVGEIFGVDEREYDLEREDVVTLPTANADPLLERDAAERIE
ncbi:DNA replication factor GINS [Halopenitus malekzadehii]|uniref:DNA replication factor GINS n=1 Tax=Halopenitus malekzadehii TaxID=1267564 RepID=A0A1H6IGI9_9EURY|nr:hypothetical protein [Halopenitus malekzadehii]SEH47908.1 DNA replication factor GINS [Halopenitus malekzadehii]